MEATIRSIGVPGPLRRLFRDRARLIAALLIAVAAIASSSVESAAVLQLQRTLDANWRGAYDILVTAKGVNVGSSTLLEPNSLGDGQNALSLAQVARVRKVAGVAVAAPLGEVVVASTVSPTPQITIPVDSAVARGASVEPQAYQFSASFYTNDGLGKRLVTTDSQQTVIDTRPGRPSVAGGVAGGCSIGTVVVNPSEYPSLCAIPLQSPANFTTALGGSEFESDSATDGAMHITLGANVTTNETITLVDPTAERKLLGKSGSFLSTLENLPSKTTASSAAMTKWATTHDSTYSQSFLAQQSGGADLSDPAKVKSYAAEYAKFLKAHPTAANADAEATRYVPVLIAPGKSANLSATISIESLGAATPTNAAAGPGVAYDFPISTANAKPVGTVSVNLTTALNPFLNSGTAVAFPGTTRAKASQTYAGVFFATTGVVNGVAGNETVKGDQATLSPAGYANPSQHPDSALAYFALTTSGATRGNESAYTKVNQITALLNGNQPLGIAVGSLSTSSLKHLESALDYVPLGAYQPVSSTVTRNGTAETLEPSVSGLGVTGARTTALASIYDAPAWGQKTPVSSIRVRVAGISAYNHQAEQKVVDVAKAIDQLGMHATIVAGSSATPVAVTVNGYAFGTTNPQAIQKVGVLGNLSQNWSELGAVARSQLAISTTNLTVLAVGLGSTAILFGAIQFASVSRRRAQSTIFRQLGWRRNRIRRWMVAEDLPGLALILLAGTASIWLAGFSVLSILVAVIAIGVVIVTSLLAIALGSTAIRIALPARRSSGRSASRTPRAFGIRQARIHPAAALTQLGATVIVALAAAAVLAIFLHTSVAAGSSLLARFTVAQASFPLLALGGAGLTAGIILSVIARQIDLRSRADQWSAMSAMGWTRANIREAQIAETITVAIPAIATAVLVSAGISSLLHLGAQIVLAGAAGIAAIVVTGVVAAAGRKATT
jgi:hypothetical protein